MGGFACCGYDILVYLGSISFTAAEAVYTYILVYLYLLGSRNCIYFVVRIIYIYILRSTIAFSFLVCS